MILNSHTDSEGSTWTSFMITIVVVIMTLVFIPMSGDSHTFAGETSHNTFALDKLDNLVEQSAAVNLTMIDPRVDAINSYFAQWDLPAQDYGHIFVKYADMYGVDYRLAPAISMRETTGGLNICKNPAGANNLFGWGSCQIDFESVDESIRVVTWNLAGLNPNTSRYYAGKTTREILETYNPPHIVSTYASEVMNIMEKISATPEANQTHKVSMK